MMDPMTDIPDSLDEPELETPDAGQPDWFKHGFIKDAAGNWRDKSRYDKELKEAELAARGMKAPNKESKAVYTPDPGHVMYTKDDLDREGISMMDLMRRLDAENVAKRTRNLSPIVRIS